MTMQGHPDEQQLAGMTEETLDPVRRRLLESHVTRCPDCLETYREALAIAARIESGPCRNGSIRRRRTGDHGSGPTGLGIGPCIAVGLTLLLTAAGIAWIASH